MSGVYILLHYALLLVGYQMLPKIGWLVAGTDVPEFIHTNTSCAALQEKLYMDVMNGLLLQY